MLVDVAEALSSPAKNARTANTRGNNDFIFIAAAGKLLTPNQKITRQNAQFKQFLTAMAWQNRHFERGTAWTGAALCRFSTNIAQNPGSAGAT
jgi:hypothetical protein